jgi:hypothetical protein
MSRMNWTAANNRQRVREHGAETVNGSMTGTATVPSAGGGRELKARRKASPLTEAIVLDKWWRNRGGEAIYVRLAPYEGQTLIDIRTWFTDKDGISRPGKGYACRVKHLARLHAALTMALAKAKELGLIDDDVAAE